MVIWMGVSMLGLQGCVCRVFQIWRYLFGVCLSGVRVVHETERRKIYTTLHLKIHSGNCEHSCSQRKKQEVSECHAIV